MRKFLCAIGILMTIGILKNPENAYIGKELEMTAISENCLQDENGLTYVVDEDLFIGETYTVKIEIHSDRVVVVDFKV